MTDAKYFTTTKKGELFDLKQEINSGDKTVKKDAIKKVIASMTVGKDVSALFQDVNNCGQTDDLGLKKLVYLYLMNYAKSQPALAIMAVNTFLRDSEDRNPLIRALAIRTMGCIRVDEITNYFTRPLRKCLKDDDPYVRKTAAISVAKLHDINGPLVEEEGFLDLLRDLLSDSNPMVVANAVAAIAEIRESSAHARDVFIYNQQTINKLLTALNECTEWGQVFILDCVAGYEPQDEREAQSIIERVTPRLSHANAAVVLSSCKVIMKFLDMLDDSSEFVQAVTKKLSAPLVTLLSAEPEIQYVALRNISLIIQRRSDILKNDLRVFFVRYNDPIYVKMEKLDIIIRLTNTDNVAQTLSELKEYASEVDVDFVRKSVRAIGRIAIRIDIAAERCIATILELFQTHNTNYVVQEAIVVLKDIFRKYPRAYESIISTLCDNLTQLDEPEAKASMIWIIGEYAERIDNAAELLETFLDSFHDENHQVQLQILTAVVKLFLKRPTDTQELVQAVLHLSTQESENPDLRDRGYIYWRLLSTNPAAAKDVVLAEKPRISEQTDAIEPILLQELMGHLSSLASIHHKPPSAFVDGAADYIPAKSFEKVVSESDETFAAVTSPSKPAGSGSGNLLDDLLNLGSPTSPPTTGHQPASSARGSAGMDLLGGGLDDLLGLSMNAPTSSLSQMSPTGPPPAAMSVMSGGLDDLLGFGGPAATVTSTPSIIQQQQQQQQLVNSNYETWLNADNCKGLQVSGMFTRKNRQPVMELKFTNSSLQNMSGFAIQFNKNSFGLTPAQPLQLPTLPAGQTSTVSLILNTNGTVTKMSPINNLQVAIKNHMDVFYFAALVPLQVMFSEDGLMDKKSYLSLWRDISNEDQSNLQTNISLDSLQDRLSKQNIFTVAKRHEDGADLLYQSVKLVNGLVILVELKITGSSVQIALKSRAGEIYPPTRKAVHEILS